MAVLRRQTELLRRGTGNSTQVPQLSTLSHSIFRLISSTLEIEYSFLITQRFLYRKNRAWIPGLTLLNSAVNFSLHQPRFALQFMFTSFPTKSTLFPMRRDFEYQRVYSVIKAAIPAVFNDGQMNMHRGQNPVRRILCSRSVCGLRGAHTGDAKSRPCGCEWTGARQIVAFPQ